MRNNKNIRENSDRKRIDPDDADEVAALEKQFPQLEASDIRQVIREYGPIRADVVNFLQKALTSGERR